MTFSSTTAADRHLVDMDERGWSRHLTADEMRALTHRIGLRAGLPWYTSRINPYGTEIWSEFNPQPHPAWRERAFERLNG